MPDGLLYITRYVIKSGIDEGWLKTVKRLVMVFLMLMLLCAGALGETVQFLNVTADTQQKHVDFGAKGVRDIEGLCAFLDQLPALERVDMYASKLTREQMDMLFERYPDVFFGWTVKIGDHTVRTDITAFSTLHGSSPKPPHTSDDFEKLKYCRNLLAIDIGHNWVEDISFLRYFPKLKVLILGQNRIKDIAPLAQLKELEYLELFSNHVRDYSALTGLTNLRDLNVKNNPCKDLSPLYQMTWLERFWAGCYVEIPKKQMKNMQEAIPGCEFDWRSMPTAGTWRKHAHYDVIHEMFTSGVYIPFDD